ncbi:P-loop containing nucleoside triphosphate hydrolase protein [Chytridium lagenaria]|nr:P-loop containing nucleoside triphosphate hydrolase protein [Chytridium lagenaria]
MQAATPPGLALWSNQTTISEDTRKSIVDIFGYKTMTDVQKQVCDLLPTENDLLVRAKTGTGKTLAFLIAAYENVMKSGGFSVKSSSILILSPTRELALQIANEAKRFVLGQKMTVRTLIGGEDRRRQKKSIAMEGRVDIIVATPGRLIDFLSTEKVMKKRIEQLKVVIFDEADQLLELGFREDMETISSHLPTNRQTFMFSATLSPNIKKIADRVLKEKRISLDTVPKDDVPTHLNVKQTYITAPYSQQVASIYKVISDHREKVPNSKIIVFFPTTRSVTNMSNLFNVISGMDIISIHSKLEQRQRSRISDRFRASRSAVLFTTDVSARGVDYPGVTLVLQVGVPTSTEQYIHRVGRTGRAGKSGEGILILSPYEKKFLQSLTGEVPIKQSFEYEPNLIARDENIQKIISQAFISYDNTDAKDSFYAHLGYCKFKLLRQMNISLTCFC